MGYRSEVVLYVGPEVMPQFMVTMSRCQAARAMCFAEHEDMIKDYGQQKGSILFKWGWLKWYDSFPEVQAIEDFLDWCESEDIPTGEVQADGERVTVPASEYFKFVRMGEDSDDNVERGEAFWGDVGIQRGIIY